jgi:hypothetical protein
MTYLNAFTFKWAEPYHLDFEQDEEQTWDFMGTSLKTYITETRLYITNAKGQRMQVKNVYWVDDEDDPAVYKSVEVECFDGSTADVSAGVIDIPNEAKVFIKTKPKVEFTFNTGGYISVNTTLWSSLATNFGSFRDDGVDELPGVQEHVKHPVTKSFQSIEYCIIDLNDNHEWSRDQVADWLESLDVDLTFKTAGKNTERS